MEYADELPDDQPLSEEEVEYAMQQALALNQYLKQMQLEAEQQPQRTQVRGRHAWRASVLVVARDGRLMQARTDARRGRRRHTQGSEQITTRTPSSSTS